MNAPSRIPTPTLLRPQELAALEPLQRLPGRNSTKADVLFYEVDGRRVAVKTYAARPAWIRHGLGRWLIRRETAAYRAAAGVPGLAEFLGRLGPYALATAWVDARPLSSLRGQHLDDRIFDAAGATLAALHERGVAVADLHHRDVLVADDGAVVLVDLATAWILGRRPGRLRRALFRHFRDHDLAALARMRARFTGSGEAAVSASTARWHARGRRAKKMLDRLRGKHRRPQGHASRS